MPSLLSRPQRIYCRNQLQILRGIAAESVAKQKVLQNKLRKHPELIDEIKVNIGKLESELDVILLHIDFIENWPQSPTEILVVADRDEVRVASSDPDMVSVTTVNLHTENVSNEVDSMSAMPAAALALLN